MQKNGTSITSYQGVMIDNDPLEREIYVQCPLC